MGAKRSRPKETVSKLDEAEALLADAVSVGGLVLCLGVTQVTLLQVAIRVWRNEG